MTSTVLTAVMLLTVASPSNVSADVPWAFDGEVTWAFAGPAAESPAVDTVEPPPAARPVARPKRVNFAGKWWDEMPDGRLVWCTECNGPYTGQPATQVRSRAISSAWSATYYGPASVP